MKIYIAGKITGDETYREKFAFAAQCIREHGDIPLDPSKLPEGMAPRDYMSICFAMIEAADLVVFLPNTPESAGARLELDYCLYTNKMIFRIDDLSDIYKVFDTAWPYYDPAPPTKYLATSIFFRCGADEGWAQIAEEASELAHAALKMRRVGNDKNPTPINVDEALDKVEEEVNDLFAALNVMDIRTDEAQVYYKLERWMERLTKAAKGGDGQ